VGGEQQEADRSSRKDSARDEQKLSSMSTFDVESGSYQPVRHAATTHNTIQQLLARRKNQSV
jgi:hypothetical protein